MLNIEQSTLTLLGFAAAVLVLGCNKPTIDIAPEKGKAGEFCISQADCEQGLACLAEYCCKNTTCETDCKSMLEKYVHINPQTRSIHPSVSRELQRNCQQWCCEGKSINEIELELRRQSMETPTHKGL